MQEITDMKKLYRIAVSESVTLERRHRKTKPGRCEVCGTSRRIHGHHKSYMPEKIFDLTWLCAKHHSRWHSANEVEEPSMDIMEEWLFVYYEEHGGFVRYK